MAKDLPLWFNPSQITFTRLQLESFLLPALADLRLGNYPTEPDEYLTYTKGIPRYCQRQRFEKQGHSNKAPFVVAVEIAAEIDDRLANIGTDYIESYYVNEIQVEDIAKCMHSSVDHIHRELKKQLTFITGWRRKRTTYNQWLLLRKIAQIA